MTTMSSSDYDMPFLDGEKCFLLTVLLMFFIFFFMFVVVIYREQIYLVFVAATLPAIPATIILFCLITPLFNYYQRLNNSINFWCMKLLLVMDTLNVYC